MRWRVLVILGLIMGSLPLRAAVAPLIKAAHDGRVSEVKQLLQSGAPVDATDVNGWTALLYALQDGHDEIARLLIDAGANVNQDTLLGTPLMVAAYRGRAEMIELLVFRGAKVNFADEEGHRALSSAAVAGRTNILGQLLTLGADLQACYEKVMEDAQAEGRFESMEFLAAVKEARGPKKNAAGDALLAAVKSGVLERVRQSLAGGANVNYQDVEGTTPLLLAVTRGSTNLVPALLEAGADPCRKDAAGRTPLVEALRRNQTNVFARLRGKAGPLCDPGRLLVAAAARGDLRLVEECLALKADVNATDVDGVSALCLAKLAFHSEVTKVLERAGGKVLNESGILLPNALLTAASEGNLGRVKQLIQKGVDVNEQSAGDRNPLCSALLNLEYDLGQTNRYAAVARLLIENGANLNKNEDLYTRQAPPLVMAAKAGHLDLVKLLLEKGSLLNGRDDMGRTALMQAAEGGHLEVVRFVVSMGANPALKDAQGHTASALARIRGHDQIMKELQ